MDDYLKWVESEANGMRVKKALTDYSFTLQYKPHTYMALMRLKSPNPPVAELNKVKELYGDLQYFTLRITSGDNEELMKAQGGDNLEYFQRLEYFSGQMQDQLRLIDGKDTLPCVLYHFERNYGLAPYSDIDLAFAGTTAKNNDKILYYEDILLGTGPIYIPISGEAIRQEPQLQLSAK